VTEQGLVYDSIVVVNPLSWNGQDNWQLLEHGGMAGADLTTYAGPGSENYYGGRWFFDNDGNGIPSEGDDFFLCPLLGPGRAAA
jgi:hypothetical protein